mmetsp:Transcript_85949/g.276463  ORF Transcript_85949/g.276463 Transcript_85949/m.276463 type:complete len:514 (-) Transcript_85949:41-1582(-)
MIFVVAIAVTTVVASYLRRVEVSIVCAVVLAGLLILRCRWPTEPGANETSRRQAWAERTCGLVQSERASRHRGLAIVIVVQGALFWGSGQRSGTTVCAVALGVLFVREVVMYYEGNSGWLIGVLEGVIIWSTVTALQFVLRQGWVMGLATLGMAVGHQFGLRRFQMHGSRIQKLTLGFMFFQLLVIVALVVMTSSSASEESTYNQFSPGGRNYTIPWRDTTGMGIQCESRFPLAKDEYGDRSAGLSLGDFGLFSAVSYDSNDSMTSSLEHFFPGWKLKHSRIARGGQLDEQARQSDWTTFFEYASPNETVSVIAIRGTDSTLDILSDINLWAPAAFMQAFELVGPWMSVGGSQAIAFWAWRPAETYFTELLRYTKKRVQEDPHRRFYITGHSLGGGLAKLVGAQVGIEAVTFMAPGLERTLYLSLNQGMRDASDIVSALLHKAVTVQPRNDLVSRVDTQVGTVIPVECDKDPFTCHKIYLGAICGLYETCGSMRPTGSPELSLPCGQCPGMPC